MNPILAAGFFETSVSTYQNARRLIPEDDWSNLNELCGRVLHLAGLLLGG